MEQLWNATRAEALRVFDSAVANPQHLLHQSLWWNGVMTLAFYSAAFVLQNCSLCVPSLRLRARQPGGGKAATRTELRRLDPRGVGRARTAEWAATIEEGRCQRQRQRQRRRQRLPCVPIAVCSGPHWFPHLRVRSCVRILDRYDPYWSMAPMVVAAFFAKDSLVLGALSARQWALLCIVFAWGLRLTLSWWRRLGSAFAAVHWSSSSSCASLPSLSLHPTSPLPDLAPCASAHAQRRSRSTGSWCTRTGGTG